MQTAHEMAKSAMKEASNEQGGAVPEGTNKSPYKGDATPKFTGHESASSAGVAGTNGPGGS